MLRLGFEGANAKELHQSITDYMESIAEGGTPVAAASTKKLKKVEDDPEDDKATPAKKTESKAKEIDDATLRAKLQGNEWPIEQAKGFLIKFGYPSITAVPQKRRQELIDLLEEASTWSAKKLTAYLEPEEL